jgi:hypothetical protein
MCHDCKLIIVRNNYQLVQIAGNAKIISLVFTLLFMYMLMG